MSNPIHRRDLGRVLGGAALSAAAASAAVSNWPSERGATKKRPWPPGIKISVQLGPDPSDEDLQFVQQLGISWVNIPGNAQTCNYENYLRLKTKVESFGIKIWNIGNANVHNMEEVTLNLPGRDQKIEEYKNFLRTMAKIGLRYTTYAHMGNGIWSSPRETTRGGAPARAFNIATAKGIWNGKEFKGPLTHGRVFTEKEIWDNYEYFIKRVAPVAEEVGVHIGIHPDDPPVPMLGGVPRCIFGSFEGYKQALEIANSPNVGVCLCCGTWMEGGEVVGATPVEAIKYFGERGKLWKIHFRNVSAPIPYFVETFVDNGYTDMWKIMRALREVNFDGNVIGDHFPQMVGGNRTSVAYTIGYMKALLARANAEFA
jgi:mannonate dehydratase